jgi:hypothetical protein
MSFTSKYTIFVSSYNYSLTDKKFITGNPQRGFNLPITVAMPFWEQKLQNCNILSRTIRSLIKTVMLDYSKFNVDSRRHTEKRDTKHLLRS